jgi:hypothetical protein
MNNAKIASETRLSARRLLVGMALAILVAYLFATASQLKLAYTHGALNYSDTWGARNNPAALCAGVAARQWTPQPVPGRYLGLAIGLTLAAALTVLRGLYFWWPLSPIGLLLAGLYPMGKMWFSFFLAWLLKWVIMRYGGGRGYRITRNLCLGMLMGDALTGGLWICVGLALGKRIYAIMPL